ncbi:MAG TPA: GTPase domain-containing protein [Candidatus Dorea intestinavium]|nr:GTPase domain-containing protein [Candidatus Dorea intestinavium]
MKRGNVLVVGNSGVGKSTLINAVLGKDVAKTGWGTSGTTRELEIYESEELPFRIIDSIGFEPSLIKAQKAVNTVKKWSKESAKEGKEDNQINLIWFCVDGTSRKLFPETIKSMVRATSMWKNVPMVVVITKSYSEPERRENINLVHYAFLKQKRNTKNLQGVLPVVAAPYIINEYAMASPFGITELIDLTNELMPQGIKAAQVDMSNFKLRRKRALAHGVVSALTVSGVVVGAVPVPFPDGLILQPIELAEVNTIAQIYEIHKKEETKVLINSIVEVGTVGIAARAALNALKVVPGINLAASVMNAIIAGAFVAAIGEGTIYAFEQVYLGKKSIEDIDWFKKIIESKISNDFIKKVTEILEKTTSTADTKTISKLINSVFR